MPERSSAAWALTGSTPRTAWIGKGATVGREAAPPHTGAKPADALEEPYAQLLAVAGVEQQRAVERAESRPRRWTRVDAALAGVRERRDHRLRTEHRSDRRAERLRERGDRHHGAVRNAELARRTSARAADQADCLRVIENDPTSACPRDLE
jgi:hypothetical protein